MKRSICINTAIETPIFQQIVGGVEQKILSGELSEGEFLVSVRELAIQLQVNPNTVAKSYKVLQDMNLVESVRGKGLRVKKISSLKSENRKNKLLKEKVSELLKVSDGFGLSTEELINFIKQEKK